MACHECERIAAVADYDVSGWRVLTMEHGWRYCEACDCWIDRNDTLYDAANFDPFDDTTNGKRQCTN